jgi:hypothetical protein
LDDDDDDDEGKESGKRAMRETAKQKTNMKAILALLARDNIFGFLLYAATGIPHIKVTRASVIVLLGSAPGGTTDPANKEKTSHKMLRNATRAPAFITIIQASTAL